MAVAMTFIALNYRWLKVIRAYKTHHAFIKVIRSPRAFHSMCWVVILLNHLIYNYIFFPQDPICIINPYRFHSNSTDLISNTVTPVIKMSDAQDFAGSFRDNNEEIFDFLYRGVYHHPVYVIDSILNDDEIKAKLTRILDFYHKPNEQSKARLERDLKLHGTHPLTNTMKNFIVQLSLKIDLNQEQTLRLVELFFISHPGVYERVKSQETEQVQKELGNLFRPIIDLYYKERINLIKAGTQIVINATAEGHPAQPVCSEFIAEILENKYNEKIWNQYKEICKKEIPSSVYAPQEREEWFMQTLKEEKQLLELLVLLNYGFVHCTPERFVEYLNVYTDQEFKGSYKIIVADSHLNEYRLGSREILMQISDLSLFHLLSSIRLDIFATQGALPGVLSVKNPYNLISNPDQTRKIHEFFVGLTGNLERLSGQIGPVVLAWYCLLMWGQHFPQSQIDVSSIDLKPLEFLIQNFDILSYLHQITKRSPFNGPQIELSCALKYILINLISTFSYQIKIEDKNNFLGLVQTTCACLENEGSSDALRHF